MTDFIFGWSSFLLAIGGFILAVTAHVRLDNLEDQASEEATRD